MTLRRFPRHRTIYRDMLPVRWDEDAAPASAVHAGFDCGARLGSLSGSTAGGSPRCRLTVAGRRRGHQRGCHIAGGTRVSEDPSHARRQRPVRGSTRREPRGRSLRAEPAGRVGGRWRRPAVAPRPRWSGHERRAGGDTCQPAAGDAAAIVAGHGGHALGRGPPAVAGQLDDRPGPRRARGRDRLRRDLQPTHPPLRLGPDHATAAASQRGDATVAPASASGWSCPRRQRCRPCEDIGAWSSSGTWWAPQLF